MKCGSPRSCGPGWPGRQAATDNAAKSLPPSGRPLAGVLPCGHAAACPWRRRFRDVGARPPAVRRYRMLARLSEFVPRAIADRSDRESDDPFQGSFGQACRDMRPCRISGHIVRQPRRVTMRFATLATSPSGPTVSKSHCRRRRYRRMREPSNRLGSPCIERSRFPVSSGSPQARPGTGHRQIYFAISGLRCLLMALGRILFCRPPESRVFLCLSWFGGAGNGWCGEGVVFEGPGALRIQGDAGGNRSRTACPAVIEGVEARHMDVRFSEVVFRFVEDGTPAVHAGADSGCLRDVE